MTNGKTIAPSALGSCLVIGSCGFLGYHLIRHLLHDDACEAVYAVDVNITRNRHDGVTYIAGNISDSALLHDIITEHRPRVIFHAASPIASLPAQREQEYYDTNVKGTEVLLTVAAESEAVNALVLTSSVDTYASPPHHDVSESHPLWSTSDRSNEYNRTKAIGDRLVRAANSPQLRTVALRLGHAYGERCSQGLHEVLDLCSGNQKLVQVGSGENLFEVVSADNVAMAHILAAKALLDPSRAAGKVDGEAFNISDGVAVPFWHHIRMIWTAARGKEALNGVIVLPTWIMAVAVYVASWLFWIFTLNTRKPPVELRKTALDYCTNTHTYSIEKAKKVLHFEPVSDHDAIVQESARLMLEERKGA